MSEQEMSKYYHTKCVCAPVLLVMYLRVFIRNNKLQLASAFLKLMANNKKATCIQVIKTSS